MLLWSPEQNAATKVPPERITATIVNALKDGGLAQKRPVLNMLKEDVEVKIFFIIHEKKPNKDIYWI